MRVFLLGGVRKEADANPIVFCLAVLVFSPPLPSLLVHLPHSKAQELVGSKGSQWQKRLGLELWILFPFSPPAPHSQLLFVTGSDGCLPGCVAYLYLAAVILWLVGSEKCALGALILGIEGIHPSHF